MDLDFCSIIYYSVGEMQIDNENLPRISYPMTSKILYASQKQEQASVLARCLGICLGIYIAHIL